MGILDKIKQMAGENKNRITDGVDQATDAVDKKTGGKHHDTLQRGDDAADKFADRLKDTGDDR